MVLVVADRLTTTHTNKDTPNNNNNMTTTTTDEALPVPMAPPQGGGDLRERLLSPQDVTMDSELDPQNWTRGEKQEGHCCRDWFFALLFYAHLAAVMTLAILWGFPTLLHPESTLPGNNQTGNLTTISTSSSKTAGDGLVGFLYLLLFLGAGSLVVSSIVLSVMAAFSSVLIQASVLFNVLASILIMVMFAATGNPGGAFGAFVLFALSSCYAFSVWERIPFAAANLTTGVTAIRTNVGVAVVPVTLSVLAWAYTFVWATSLYGALHQFQPQTSCNDAGAQDCNKTIKEVIIGVYLVLFFWTMQVITVRSFYFRRQGSIWAVVDLFLRSCCGPSERDACHGGGRCRHLVVCSGRSIFCVFQSGVRLVCPGKFFVLWVDLLWKLASWSCPSPAPDCQGTTTREGPRFSPLVSAGMSARHY